MTIIARWAMQGVALFLFAWMAAVASQWNSAVVDGSRSDRLSLLDNGATTRSSFKQETAAEAVATNAAP